MIDKFVTNARRGDIDADMTTSPKGLSTVYRLKMHLNKVFFQLVSFCVEFVMDLMSVFHLSGRSQTCNCGAKHTYRKEEKNLRKSNHYKDVLPDQGAPYPFCHSLSFDASPTVQRQLEKLEEKVSLLNRIHEMPTSKETLTGAVIERMKTLEAELAETRKILLVVLRKQSELYECLEQLREKESMRKASCWLKAGPSSI